MRAGVVCEQSSDPIGVELAGVAKNAAALAAGATEARRPQRGGRRRGAHLPGGLALRRAPGRAPGVADRAGRHRRPRRHRARAAEPQPPRRRAARQGRPRRRDPRPDRPGRRGAGHRPAAGRGARPRGRRGAGHRRAAAADRGRAAARRLGRAGARDRPAAGALRPARRDPAGLGAGPRVGPPPPSRRRTARGWSSARQDAALELLGAELLLARRLWRRLRGCCGMRCTGGRRLEGFRCKATPSIRGRSDGSTPVAAERAVVSRAGESAEHARHLTRDGAPRRYGQPHAS